MRLVEPYCHGVTRTGAEALRAVQVGGASRSGALGALSNASGKLWLVDKMVALTMSDETFAPDDPHYQPADKAMRQIHCRI